MRNKVRAKREQDPQQTDTAGSRERRGKVEGRGQGVNSGNDCEGREETVTGRKVTNIFHEIAGLKKDSKRCASGRASSRTRKGKKKGIGRNGKGVM